MGNVFGRMKRGAWTARLPAMGSLVVSSASQAPLEVRSQRSPMIQVRVRLSQSHRSIVVTARECALRIGILANSCAISGRYQLSMFSVSMRTEANVSRWFLYPEG